MSLSLVLAAAAAASYADLGMIDTQVAQFTGAPIGALGGAAQPVDRRLRLRPCGSPLAFAWNSQQRETVVVQCPDAGGWRLYVPVRATDGGALAAPAVNRGDAVTVAVTGEGFTVSQPGEALESGPVGAWIRVRLDRGNGPRPSNDAMRAQIIRPGLVGVPLP